MAIVLTTDSESGVFQRWITDSFYIKDESVHPSHMILDFLTDPHLIPEHLPMLSINNDANSSQNGLAPRGLPTKSPTHGDGDSDLDGLVPLNADAWDWKRFLGLGLLLGTIICTSLLMLLASFHQRRMREQVLWGNMATRDGVEELLKMGWKFDGTRMEVYDKGKIGYDDNDSMLIGGFEQKVAVTVVNVVVATTESVTRSGDMTISVATQEASEVPTRQPG